LFLRSEGPRVVYVRDTLELEHVLVSEVCRPLVESREGIEIVSNPAPLRFDGRGRLRSPFADSWRYPVAEPSVVITDLMADELAPERETLGPGIRLEALDARREEDLAGRIEDADAVIVYQVPVSRCTIERLERCRVIVRGGVGYDNVDGPFARERGIALANVPDYCTEEVADSALGLMLALTRGLSSSNSRLRAAEIPWSYAEAAPLRRLRGRVLGIVGLGRIGTATALRAKALGMDVAYYDPYKPLGFDKALGLRHAETLEELVRQSWSPEPALSADAGDPEHDRRARAVAPAGGRTSSTLRGAGSWTRPPSPLPSPAGSSPGSGSTSSSPSRPRRAIR
jgi:D-3-phosphoglycerate dehydrogenase/C-terminal binding protein